jgi:hypothetical protein
MNPALALVNPLLRPHLHFRRAYADWANPQFGRYQQDLPMNGVDLIQVVRFGAARKNAADIPARSTSSCTTAARPTTNPRRRPTGLSAVLTVVSGPLGMN